MAKRDSLTSGRTRRAIKMGELASQVGTSYLWTSLRRPFLNASQRDKELLETHIRNARRIVEGSTQLRGAFLKLIQMLSMRHDLLPGEALDVLRATQSGVPPMSYAMIPIRSGANSAGAPSSFSPASTRPPSPPPLSARSIARACATAARLRSRCSIPGSRRPLTRT